MKRESHKDFTRVAYTKAVTISQMRKEIDRIEKQLAKENDIYGDDGMSSKDFFGVVFYVKSDKKKKSKWKK